MARSSSKPHVFDAQLSDSKDLQQFFENNEIVTVTGFFRKSDLFEDLQNRVLPACPVVGRELLLWSAGCSDGREVLSAAVAIREYLQTLKQAEIRFHCIGSDISQIQIASARKRRYNVRKDEALKINTHPQSFRWVNAQTVEITNDLSPFVTFRREDILKTDYKGKFDIILCTNVLLYYNAELKKRITEKLIDCLKPGGFLYVESVGSRYMNSNRMARLCTRSHFFRKHLELEKQ